MRTTVSGALAAAAFASAMFIAGALPASAQVARPLSALAVGDSDDGVVTLVRRGGGGGGGGGGMRGGGGGYRGAYHGGGYRGGYHGGGYRGGYRVAGRHHYRGNYHHGHRHYGHRHHGHGNWWWGAGGLALGYGLGYGYSDYGYYDDPYYYRPAVYAGSGAVTYCARRFRSYDPQSRTYVNNKGQLRSCG